jgi:hypothetical protein
MTLDLQTVGLEEGTRVDVAVFAGDRLEWRPGFIRSRDNWASNDGAYTFYVVVFMDGREGTFHHSRVRVDGPEVRDLVRVLRAHARALGKHLDDDLTITENIERLARERDGAVDVIAELSRELSRAARRAPVVVVDGVVYEPTRPVPHA